MESITKETLAGWMKSALAIAVEGIAKGESPFGACIYGPDGVPLSREHNQVASTNRPTAHAEILAIESACVKKGESRLPDHWLVATGEPCPMCFSAAALAGIRHIVYGGPTEVIKQSGYETLDISVRSLSRIVEDTFDIHGPILQFDCSALLLNHPRESQTDGSVNQ
ncbi:tRNA-specific adenosine deaminase [Roseimaritima multifibrata]|uniref:tRNA-specific adenosine deaminase n=2 Tax=Roseimaritima multifibrata TaxID=1930274 RepID=A0A517MLW6_9BACT|nr:tRNA-specific adenosine deaminase [Roseimaritima multifibrata]